MLHWCKLLVYDGNATEEPIATLGDMVSDPEKYELYNRSRHMVVKEDEIKQWDGFFIAAPGETPDFYTPSCVVDWSAFAMCKAKAIEKEKLFIKARILEVSKIDVISEFEAFEAFELEDIEKAKIKFAKKHHVPSEEVSMMITTTTDYYTGVSFYADKPVGESVLRHRCENKERLLKGEIKAIQSKLDKLDKLNRGVAIDGENKV